MKTIIRKCFVTLSISACLFIGSISICYASGQGSVTIAYVKEESDKYNLSVSVEGSGELRDGNVVIRKQTNVYELKNDESKTFQLIADMGGAFEQVTLNGKDITSQVKNNTIEVAGQNYSQELHVKFKNVSVNTGDTNKRMIVMLPLIVSAGLIISIISKKMLTRWKKKEN